MSHAIHIIACNMHDMHVELTCATVVIAKPTIGKAPEDRNG